MNKTVAIIGAGRVGSSLGYLLHRGGYRVIAVAARSLDSARKSAVFIGAGAPTTDVVAAASGADIVFITTPDGAIGTTCATIASGGGFRQGALAVHACGAKTLALLDSAKKAGAYRAVIHPLQSLATREQGINNLAGSYFRIEADPEALASARNIVKTLGGIELAMPKWISDNDSVALYHAGAVAASNYFVALVDYALQFYVSLGADKHEALQALLPLLKGTLHNIEALGTAEALTGPIARGDVETIRGHLEAMQRKTPELLGLYEELARHTVAVARAKGTIDQQKAEDLLKQLS